jgi:hypothetical protein
MNGIDHPLLRRESRCPICGDTKSAGLVWCWPCHNETQLGPDDAREAAEDKLDAAEEKLEERET